ncbi:FAD binding domain-containing protein [Aspergillus pseudodeflectus]|uniref:FAD binding domain-containing protein n=1 Tax=Aspergillus pseudodeflectus TaxID=176178 RepID=A0ABR4L6D8_9EURO
MSPSKVVTETFHDDVPILIVGGGPSGLLLAHMLSRLNVQTLIVERYATRLAAPKAHALSPRSLELCRQFGLDVNEVRRLGTSREDAYWVNFITNLSGKQVGRLPYERMDPDVLDATPTMIHNIPQPDFEELVTRNLKESPLNEIRKHHSFVRLEELDDYVLTTVEDRSSGREYVVRSKHVVACDGAKSAVRRFLEVESEGEDSYETMMTIHFNADLRPVVGDRVGMLHWVMDPETSGFIIGYDLSGNQVLICNFDPEKHPVESWNESLCRKTLNAAIGQHVKYDVLSYRPWVLSRKVANQYRIGRVFLAGDAAHSFPPTGGLGLNSGLGDVHNLAYKLAAVHQGWARDGVLDTYHADRRQVALVNSQQSVKNGQKIFGLLKALGTTDKDVQVARENLHRNLKDPDAVVEINRGIEEQREHFDNLQLHIGYVYGDTRIPENASLYKPLCVPGARLPHAWIRLLEPSDLGVELPAIDSSYVSELAVNGVERKRYSTLDLCPVDTFILVVHTATADQWRTYVLEALRTLPPDARSTPKVKTVVMGKQFVLEPSEHSTAWINLMGLNSGQATLVRPDQHILACFDTANVQSSDLRKALGDHLGW